MSDERKTPAGSLSRALVAGAVVLGTGPVALGLLMLMSARDGEGWLLGIATLVQEGGLFSYGVLVLGALASLVAAGLAGLSVRRPGLPAPLALVPFLLPMLAALGGVISGMRGVVSAVSHVAPSDKGTILLAAMAELESLDIQALTFCAAGLWAVALAALVSFDAPGRGGRVMTALGGFALGLSLAASAGQGFALRNGFSAIAHVSPADRLTILMGTIGDWQQLSLASGAAFLGCLLVALGGAGILVSGGQRSAGIGAAAALLVAAVGFRGFHALSEHQLFAPSREHLTRARTDLVTFEGRTPLREDFVALGEGDGPIDTAVARSRKRDEETHWVALELPRGLGRAPLLRAMQTAHYLLADVELVGGGARPPLDVPPVFEAALLAVTAVPQSAPLRVLFSEQPCEGCAGVATLTPSGLQVKSPAGEVLAWAPAAVPSSGEVDSLPGVEFDWTTGEPEPLLRAALVALSHGHLLVARIPAPAQLPELPDY